MITEIILAITFFSTPQEEPTRPQPCIENAVEAIRSIPEGSQLLDTIDAEGPVAFELREIEDFDFGALWDARSRRVVVNAKRCHNQGILISSILFELHNAKTSGLLISEAKKAIMGNRTKEQYVENIERIEHDNALSTIAILNKGIARGVFPPTAEWTIIRNFDDHYKLQQLSGHSQWIANNFDSMVRGSTAPYHGTIHGLEMLTEGNYSGHSVCCANKET